MEDAKVTAYITLQRHIVDRDGKSTLLLPGDLIPEFANWDNKDVWLARGRIKKIEVPIPDSLIDELLERATTPVKKRKSA